jgi:hypothetical protein
MLSYEAEVRNTIRYNTDTIIFHECVDIHYKKDEH